MPETVVPPNLQLIGGEMLVWSDDDANQRRVPAHGRLLEIFAQAASPPNGRVLIAGPHSSDMVAAMAGRGGQVTCLLRSYPDGTALAQRFAGAGVRVLCGSLAKLGPDEQFDAIVALDGLQRLASVEGVSLNWGEALEALLAALRPGGRLLLALDNLLGVHRLVEMSPWYADETDAGWTPVGEYDESRPRSLSQLVEWLTARGLNAGQTFAGYPLPGAPSVLLSTAGVTGEAALEGYLDATVSAACGEGFAGAPVLADPRRLATTALRSGLGGALAPLWIVVADRGPEGGHQPTVPEILVADAWEQPGWGVEYAVTADEGGRWRRDVVGDPAPREAGPVRRDPAGLVGPVPVGRSLEEVLLGACLRRDLPELRRLLIDYAGWLAGHCDDGGRLPGGHVFVTPRYTAVSGTEFTPMDRSWALDRPLPFEVALTRGLRQFAVTLITGGYSHPWPSTIDADSLSVILAGMAGHIIQRTAVQRAVDVEVEIVSAIRGFDDAQRAEFAERFATVDASTPPLDVDSHRKLLQSVLRMREELEHTEAKLAWFEELLTSREYSLKRAQRTINLLSGSVSFRVGRMLITPARWFKRGLRKLLRMVSPRRDGQ